MLIETNEVNQNFSEFMNYLVRCWSCTTEDIGVFECIGQFIVVERTDRFKYGCGSEAYT